MTDNEHKNSKPGMETESKKCVCVCVCIYACVWVGSDSAVQYLDEEREDCF